jgi:hypothetical protein
MQTSTDIAARNKNAAYYGLSPRVYLDLGHFSIAAEKAGVKSTAIKKGPLGQGARLELSGPDHNYEVLVGNGQMLLGRVNGEERTRLCEGSTNTQSQWNRMLDVLKASEGRAA